MLSPTTVLKKATGVADRALSALHPLDAQCIEPRLYLTAYPTANDPNVLSRLGVTHVVSLLGHDITLPEFIKNENKLHIKIHDIGVVDLLGKFEKTTDFIRSALEENSTNVVLVSRIKLEALYGCRQSTGSLPRWHQPQPGCDMRVSDRN